MTRNDRKIITSILPVVIFISLCALSVYYFLFRPTTRQIGLTFRNTLYVLPLIFLTALCCNLLRNPYARTICLSILFTSVLLPYSGLINSGLSDQYALGGVIPWSDAFTMQLNSQRFLYGGMMEQSTAIRPISLVFYSLFLRAFGRNYFALQVFLCIMTALCLLFAMRAVSRTYGAVCGAVFFTILYYYCRQRLGTFMTEPFGFICGLLSCGLLLNGISSHRQRYMLTGFLLLSIGMNARPAAMFLFPFLGLWYFFIFLRNDHHKFLWGTLALILMLSGFVINRAAQKTVYGDKPIPNRQAAEMVYGLCLGGRSWGEVVASPEMTALKDSENIIKDLTDLCAPIIKEHPENIFSALRTIFIDSLIRSEYYGAFSFVNGNPKLLDKPVRYFLMAVWLAGAWMIIKRRKDAKYSFLLAGIIGIILSECAAVPFSTNYLRLYAVSMWVPACTTGILPEALLRRFLNSDRAGNTFMEPVLNGFAVLACSVIVFASLLGPGIIRSYTLESPAADANFCNEGDDVLLTSVDPGSFIYLDDKDNIEAEFIPYFRLPYVRQHIHDTASVEMFPFTDSIESPTAIIRGIDLNNMSDALIFSPLDLVKGKTGYAQFCGKFIDPPILRNDRFFIPTSVLFFEDNL